MSIKSRIGVCAVAVALAAVMACGTASFAEIVYTDVAIGDATYAGVVVPNLQNWVVSGAVTSSSLTIGSTAQPTAMISIGTGGSWTATSLIMANGAGSLGTLNISGTGSLTTTSTGYVGRAGGGEAVINISGGQWNHSGGQMNLGYTTLGETVTVTQSGGSVNMAGGILAIANVENATATYSISGGTFYITNHISIGRTDDKSNGRLDRKSVV